MTRVLHLLLAVALLVLAAGLAGAAPQATSFNVRTVSERAIEVSVTPGQLEYGPVETEAGVFAAISITGEGFSNTIGQAKLPAIRRMVEIPQGAVLSVRLTSAAWDSTSLAKLGLSGRIVPLQPPVRKTPEPRGPFAVDLAYYGTSGFCPEDVVRIIETAQIRGRRVALIEISPVQYNPASGSLRVMRSCELRIDLFGSDMAATLEAIGRYATPSSEELFRRAFADYGAYERLAGSPKGQEEYLFIVYDSFADALAPLVEWKQSIGFATTVTKTSQIPGGPTKENIKAYIQDAYNNWPIPPTYLLLVGDTAQIPTWIGGTSGTATDLNYVTVSGSDYFADIFRGRFPAASAAQVTAMVDKTLCFEREEFPSDEFITKGAFMASEDNYTVSEGTHNYVISTYMIPNGYTCDKLYSHTYHATTAQVKAALNNGRMLAVYSGHGSDTSWADGPPFSQSDVNSLTNYQMYPFVCSHACLTGNFATSECFGETWLRASGKAGLAFWGSSNYTYWDEDDILEKKAFSAWWDEGLETIGPMTDMGLYRLYQYYGGGGLTRYYFECYNVLGDSSVNITSPGVWTEAPVPEPYCGSPLFGPGANGYPAWVWFSIPLVPPDPTPEEVLGFDCGGTLWMLDPYEKSIQVYQPPYVSWDLQVGRSYLLYLEGDVPNPAYSGYIPESPFSVKLGRAGWTWIGMPGPRTLGYPDFMGAVQVEYPVGGDLRTAAQDRVAAAPWLNWGWSFFDTNSQAAKTLTPYAPFGCNTSYPWLGYRAYVNVGTAQNEADPDQVTLIWPE
jgi:hypothetical protein